MNKDKLSALIKSPDLERMALILSKPNIFEILRVANTEIRHSNFLAWILDPNNSHNLKDVFLRWFLKEVLSDEKVKDLDEFAVDQLQTSHAKVFREYKNIDILIELPTVVVVIENKFWSKESNGQLEKYNKIAKKDFPDKVQVFVYLTPFADDSVDELQSQNYVTFSYKGIVALLENILQLYSDSISEKVETFIRDFIAVIRRYIMEDDTAVQLAQEIYRNHRTALDFIFEHKPDHLSELIEPIGNAVTKLGYQIIGNKRGHCAFLTPELIAHIPVSESPELLGQPVFRFELQYRNRKHLTLICLVGPCETEIRKNLITALCSVPKANKGSTAKWTITHSVPSSISLHMDNLDNPDEVEQKVFSWLSQQSAFINQIQSALLATKLN